jgi:putative Holliday junction resolvase
MFLGFDFGMKFIGVATGQNVTNTASPLTSLRANDGIPAWDDIEALLKTWKPEAIIVGIPLQMDGATQLTTHCAKKFANRLRERFKIPVYMVDERLSTWEAKQRLKSPTKTPKYKQLPELNALAAAVLLEQWLHDNSKANN